MSEPSVRAVRCVCLTGPTACGKTELAFALAAAMPVEIVSMVSAMVYRGMDIGTAKPSLASRRAVRHHLIDIRDPAEPYSAGQFARDARAALADIASRGRLPLFVGGTLLYLRALRDGLAAMPRGDREIRARLDALGAAEGWEALHRQLAARDPAAAARISPSDRQRIQRALEVHELAGRPLSELHLAGGGRRAGLDMLVIALLPEDRAALAARIEARFDAMLAAGLLAEVETLNNRADLLPSLPSMRAVGYRQLLGYLAGETDFPEARRRALAATRQLAKRQLTWLKAERDCERWRALTPGLAERCIARVAAFRLADTPPL